MKKGENNKHDHNASNIELKHKLVEVTDAVRKKIQFDKK
jgi:hypothetical protein